MSVPVAPPSSTASGRRFGRFVEVAKAAGVKLTHQRLEIFREVAESLEHPDAEMVFRAVRARVPTVSLDTVYRTLWRLHELGLITTLGPQRDSVRFDPNTDPHHHFVCLRCGMVRDFESEELNSIRFPDSVNQLGMAMATHVEVRGVCAQCRKQSDSRPPRTSRPKTPKGERA